MSMSGYVRQNLEEALKPLNIEYLEDEDLLKAIKKIEEELKKRGNYERN